MKVILSQFRVMDSTDGIFSSAKEAIQNAVSAAAVQLQYDWGKMEWSRVDGLLKGRFILADDRIKLYQLDDEGVDDSSLQAAVEVAVKRKIEFDDTMPDRCKKVRDCIKKLAGRAVMLDRPVFFELTDKAYEFDLEAHVRLALDNHEDDPEEQLKREYLLLKLGDKQVGSKNFSKLMESPSERLDALCEECPGVRKEKPVEQKRKVILKLSAEQKQFVHDARRVLLLKH